MSSAGDLTKQQTDNTIYVEADDENVSKLLSDISDNFDAYEFVLHKTYQQFAELTGIGNRELASEPTVTADSSGFGTKDLIYGVDDFFNGDPNADLMREILTLPFRLEDALTDSAYGTVSDALTGVTLTKDILQIVENGERDDYKNLITDLIKFGLSKGGTAFGGPAGGAAGAVLGELLAEELSELIMRAYYDGEFDDATIGARQRRAARENGDLERTARDGNFGESRRNVKQRGWEWGIEDWINSLGAEYESANVQRRNERENGQSNRISRDSNFGEGRRQVKSAGWEWGVEDWVNSLGAEYSSANVQRRNDRENGQLSRTSRDNNFGEGRRRVKGSAWDMWDSAGTSGEAETGIDNQIQDLMQAFAEFQNTVNAFGGEQLLELKMDDNEIALEWQIENIEALDVQDQVDTANEALQNIMDFVNELLQANLLDPAELLPEDGAELQIDIEALLERAEEIKDKFTGSHDDILDHWSGFSDWLQENEWAPMGAGAEAVRSVIVDALSQVAALSSQLDQIDGRVVRLYPETYVAAVDEKLADGGILTSPRIALVGEAGPESIIPLSQARRSRGIELWQETGEILGVWPGLHPNTGSVTPLSAVTSRSGKAAVTHGDEDAVGNDMFADVSISPNVFADGDERTEAELDIHVNVTKNPDYVIQAAEGADAEDIMTLIRAHSRQLAREIADEVGGELADRLEMVYENIPLKGVS